MCIRFPETSPPEEQRLASAQLWVYLNPHEGNTTNKRTLLVSLPSSYYGKRYTLATKEVHISEGWIELPLRHAIKRFERSQHYIEITCKPNSPGGSPIADRGSLRPILAQTYAVKDRERRGSNAGTTNTCDPASTCCIRSLVIDFSELEWDWIRYPVSYSANYCIGVCTSVNVDGEYPNMHSQILSTWIMRQSQRRQQIGNFPGTCCAPTRLRNLDIIFQQPNGNLNHTTLTEVSAESCHCVGV